MKYFYVKKPIYPPIAVVLSLVFLMTGLLISKKIIFTIFLGGIVILFLAFGYMKPILRIMIFVVPLALFLSVITYGIHHDFYISAQTGGRIFLLGFCAIPLISIPPVNLTRSMETLNCPRGITLGMLVAIRFIPVFILEMKQIKEAMKTRGIKMLFNPVIAYRAFLIPLVMRLVNISEILTLSLETRAFDIHEKDFTVFKPVRFTYRDGIFLVSAFGLAAGTIVAFYI